MPIRKQEFYEGAAFHLLASTGRIVGIIDDPPFFIINGRMVVLLKYSTRGRSPWRFTFTANEHRHLQKRVEKTPNVRIGLICGSDGVATLTYDEFREVTSANGEPVQIACYRDHGEHYEISGPLGALKKKVPPSSWQRIFDK